MLFTFANDAKVKFDEYDKACREVLSLIDEKMTDLEKALVLHDHVWSLVKLDDNWYSVDVTWKDEDIAFFGN